jgi:hypothetical protein
MGKNEGSGVLYTSLKRRDGLYPTWRFRKPDHDPLSVCEVPSHQENPGRDAPDRKHVNMKKGA